MKRSKRIDERERRAQVFVKAALRRRKLPAKRYRAALQTLEKQTKKRIQKQYTLLRKLEQREIPRPIAEELVVLHNRIDAISWHVERLAIDHYVRPKKEKDKEVSEVARLIPPKRFVGTYRNAL